MKEKRTTLSKMNSRLCGYDDCDGISWNRMHYRTFETRNSPANLVEISFDLDTEILELESNSGKQTKIFVLSAFSGWYRTSYPEMDENELMNVEHSGIIELNVGGKKFTTYKSTLMKYKKSMLHSMFSGKMPLVRDSKGRIFIDRSPQYFQGILRFLRGEPIPRQLLEEEQFLAELDYFGLLDAFQKTAGIPAECVALFNIVRNR